MHAFGAILAGGGSTRMGSDKALVEVAGKPMFEWVVGALRSVTDDLVVVGRAGKLGDIECIPDDHPGRHGPLAGLATALRLTGDKPVVLVAVDQPWIRAATLNALLDLAGPIHAVIPVDGGSRQVTCGIYPAAWAGRAAEEEAAGGSIQSLLDELPHRPVEAAEWRTWGEDGRSWFSVDTREALQEGMGRFGAPV
jgi:molybdopterin-guanine dinucleotide biosynthesis protein A